MKKYMAFLFATLFLIFADNSFANKIKASCPSDTPLLDEDGYCHSCFATYEVELMFEEDIAKCVNPDGSLIRENVRFGKTILKNCPSETPLKNKKGCFPCDFGGAIEATNCNVCDGIKNPYKRSIKNELCTLDDCTNRPLKDLNGGCYTCDDKNSISVAAGTCLKTCPNRKVNSSMSYGNVRMEECGLPFDINSIDCPEDKPILNNSLECLKCDIQADIKSLKGCDKCPNRRIKGAWATNNLDGVTCVINKNYNPNAPKKDAISFEASELEFEPLTANTKPSPKPTPKPDMVFDASVLYEKPEPVANNGYEDGKTPLMKAVLKESIGLSECGCADGCPHPEAPQSWSALLIAGQNIDAQDNDGKTILTLALDDMYKFHWLIKNGASPYVKDNTGTSTFDYITKMPEEKMSKYFDIITNKGARIPCL